ncbi:MAG: hypothetical protein J6O61_05740 [Butyrivibrio sp.]|uniref:hypothetical protein n=1 Tax=Butyrivibrio sp. TaxID=28121 RepID=UPI001B287039|nr:hypothetical protein [Butyrivibrio sp.]MBO6240328.1 hypothetical protein [Butyrivibrio sp.]
MGIKKNKYFFRRLHWPIVNRKHKDTVFRLLFGSDKAALLELYNAINNSHYDDPNDLIINTLDSAIFMGMRNDLSFIIDTRLNIYEHQSTDCKNIPLRCLFYVGNLYQQLVDDTKIYGSKLLKIPEPHFVVFYNGTDSLPEEVTYKLSDMYENRSDNPELELTVKIININQGMNDNLMKSCKNLSGYSTFVAKIREYNEFYPLPIAVRMAVDYCIDRDILKDFFVKERKAVYMYSLFEYNQRKHMKYLEKEAREIGLEEGLEEGRKKGLEEGRKKGLE